MTIRDTEQSSRETRQRLLEAAGEIFAEQGFRCATVRDICRRAHANVAAINYHFGDKQRLYAEVLRYAWSCSDEAHPPNMGIEDPSLPPEQRLATFIRSFMHRMFHEGRPAWQGKIEAREMIEPTAALDTVVEQQLRPRAHILDKIVRDILGHGSDEQTVRHCCSSIVGQCVFYAHSRPVITRLYPQIQYDPQHIEQLTDHIIHFSLAGLKSLAPQEHHPLKPTELDIDMVAQRY